MRELRTAIRAASQPGQRPPRMARPGPAAPRTLALLPRGLAGPAMPGSSRRRRCTGPGLGYDEMLAHQLAMAWMKAREKRRPGRSLLATGTMRAEALRRFGFGPPPRPRGMRWRRSTPTWPRPRRMLRLLQGDVGSGKTLVALLAMLGAVESGAQAALMAPTEVLAKQHLRTLERLAPCPVGLLTGSVTGAARRNLLLQLNNGRLPIVVGTHALFQEAVEFKGPRPGRDRRAAPLRRRTTHAAGRQGGADRPAGDDRHPHPAHVAADPVGRDGGQPPDGKACRPPTHPHHAALAGHAGKRDRRHRPRPVPGRAGLLGLSHGVRKPADRPGRGRGALRGTAHPASAPVSAWRTASRTVRCATRLWLPSPPGKPACWWPRP